MGSGREGGKRTGCFWRESAKCSSSQTLLQLEAPYFNALSRSSQEESVMPKSKTAEEEWGFFFPPSFFCWSADVIVTGMVHREMTSVWLNVRTQLLSGSSVHGLLKHPQSIHSILGSIRCMERTSQWASIDLWWRMHYWLRFIAGFVNQIENSV